MLEMGGVESEVDVGSLAGGIGGVLTGKRESGMSRCSCSVFRLDCSEVEVVGGCVVEKILANGDLDGMMSRGWAIWFDG